MVQHSEQKGGCLVADFPKVSDLGGRPAPLVERSSLKIRAHPLVYLDAV
jgi:hypothetical protein